MMTDNKKYLSKDKVRLNAQGFSYNGLYYSNYNSSVETIECTFYSAKNRLSLNNLQLGGNAHVNIPNTNFVDQTWLHLELPSLPVDCTLCRGWGYGIIRDIEFTMGASTSKMRIDGSSVMAIVLSMCKTEEQRSEIMKLAGEEHLSPPTAPVGEDAPKLTADILLPLPFSSFCKARLPYDTSIITNNIDVTINFRDITSIMGGSGTGKPSAFSKAFIAYREGILTNRADSLKWELMANPELSYQYPFIHYQHQRDPVTGSRESTGAPVIVDLTGFINADILGLYFILREKADVIPPTNNVANPLVFRDFVSPQLSYNGQPIYYSDYKSWKLMNIGHNQGATFFHSSEIVDGTTAPFNSTPHDSYILYVDMSRIRQQCIDNETLPNVERIGNQTLILEFFTPKAVDYLLDSTYIYSAAISSQAGVTEIYF